MPSSLTLKKISLVILLIPTGFLSLFLFGEVLTGDLSGFSHVLQILPLVVLAWLVWKKPLIGGTLLVVISGGLGLWYYLSVDSSLITILLVELFLFAPPFISGIIAIWSAKKSSS